MQSPRALIEAVLQNMCSTPHPVLAGKVNSKSDCWLAKVLSVTCWELWESGSLSRRRFRSLCERMERPEEPPCRGRVGIWCLVC